MRDALHLSHSDYPSQVPTRRESGGLEIDSSFKLRVGVAQLKTRFNILNASASDGNLLPSCKVTVEGTYLNLPYLQIYMHRDWARQAFAQGLSPRGQETVQDKQWHPGTVPVSCANEA